MYALAILRYRRPLEEVLPHVDEHRAYLRDLKTRGILIASGPQDPRTGGALLIRVPDGAPPRRVARPRRGAGRGSVYARTGRAVRAVALGGEHREGGSRSDLRRSRHRRG